MSGGEGDFSGGMGVCMSEGIGIAGLYILGGGMYGAGFERVYVLADCGSGFSMTMIFLYLISSISNP